jgi:DNA repair protein RadC
MVTARDVLRPLVDLGASAAILAHNHPSGDPSPSAADRELTARLVVACALVGVPLVDHLVVAASGHHSFAAEGRLPKVRRQGHRRGNVGQGIGIG